MLSTLDISIIAGGLILFTIVAYLRIRVRNSLNVMVVANLMLILPLLITMLGLDDGITLISIIAIDLVGVAVLSSQYNNQIGLPYRRMYAALVRAEDNKNLDVTSTLDTKITGEMEKLQDKQVRFINSMAVLVNNIYTQKQSLDNYLDNLSRTGTKMEDEISTVTNDIDNILQTASVISEQVDEIRKQGLELIDKTESDFNVLREISAAANRVTDQTNIIAVNAAIEAAQVELEGSNFGTVADGIQAISKRSRDTTDKLSHSIGNLRRELIREIGGINIRIDKLEERVFELGELANRSSSFAHQQQSFVGEIREISKQVENRANEIQSIIKLYVNE